MRQNCNLLWRMITDKEDTKDRYWHSYIHAILTLNTIEKWQDELILIDNGLGDWVQSQVVFMSYQRL